jgi:hypothetical protein
LLERAARATFLPVIAYGTLKIALDAIGLKGVDWIYLAESRYHCRADMKMLGIS